jgi:IS30 family transposase
VSKKGDKNSLLVLLDRYSRYVFVRKVKDKKPRRILNEIDRIAKMNSINSITFDNGIEFQQHYKLNCNTYFCHPYSSWEKGAVEYANRLIRRYIPKKTYIKDYSKYYIQAVIEKLNHTPRKCLNYKTPYEVYFNSNSPNHKNTKCCT